jgi:hypothetical protein
MQAGREYEPQKTVVLVYMPFAHLWWHAPQHSLDHTTACNCGAEHLRRRVTKKNQRIGEGHRPVQIAQPSPDLRTSTTQYSGPATHPSVSASLSGAERIQTHTSVSTSYPPGHHRCLVAQATSTSACSCQEQTLTG